MNISADNLKNKNMSKRKSFAPLLGVVVLGLSAYAGHRTYDTYKGVSESDLLLMNGEALAHGGEGADDCRYSNGYTWFTSKSGGAYDCCTVWVAKKPGYEHCR